ncbi:MAG TPA: Lrp/AsnC family transcriptional regulator [Ferruginibacter sp.]|nr:Lrp/AsnC family transcriptional regulator [Ferruginibacter sp.]HRO96096.1 Lrp/AsnC family transcriptional regulator [Ferruginibacter sp.]
MTKKVKKVESTESITLDEKDFSILKLLQENARLTVKEIAERVHLSTTPVHERIKRMEASGVICQYITLVDAAKVQKGLNVICYVSIREHSKNAGLKFIKAINDMPEVLQCYSISGAFDFMLKVVCSDMNAYYDFHVQKLSQLENVGNVQSVFVMGVIKDSHQLIW